jgi:hypothetical protein
LIPAIQRGNIMNVENVESQGSENLTVPRREHANSDTYPLSWGNTQEEGPSFLLERTEAFAFEMTALQDSAWGLSPSEPQLVNFWYLVRDFRYHWKWQNYDKLPFGYWGLAVCLKWIL